MKLYEINKHLREVIEQGVSIDFETGEFFEETDFDKLEEERLEKLEACAVIAKEKIAEEAVLKAEMDTLMKRRKALTRSADWLKSYIKNSMEMVGDSKLETPKVTMSLRATSRVEILNEEEVPEDFKEIIEQCKIDKIAIKKAFKDGDVAGALLISDKSLVVK